MEEIFGGKEVQGLMVQGIGNLAHMENEIPKNVERVC